MPKKRILVISGIVATVLLAAGLLYYLNRGWWAYFFYSLKVRNQPGYADSVELLQSGFKKIFENPQDGQAYADLAGVQSSLGDYASAEENFRQALSIEPRNQNILILFYNALRAQKKYAAAEQAAKDLISAAPQSPLGYSQLIELYQFYLPEKSGELPGFYQRAYEQTKDGQFLIAGATFLAEQKGEYAPAVKLLQEWLSQNPGDASRPLIVNLLADYQRRVK